jgi:hypothetical protein
MKIEIITNLKHKIININMAIFKTMFSLIIQILIKSLILYNIVKIDKLIKIKIIHIKSNKTIKIIINNIIFKINNNTLLKNKFNFKIIKI